MTKANHPITVYFDGSCPLCVREIGLYQRLKARNQISWVDVSTTDFATGRPGLSQCDAMQRFHISTREGTLISGAAAFALLWQQFDGWRYLGWFVALPGINKLAELAYRGSLVIRPALQKLVRRLVQS